MSLNSSSERTLCVRSSDPIALSPDEYFKRDAFGRFSACSRASQASYIPSLKANEVQFVLFRLSLE